MTETTARTRAQTAEIIADVYGAAAPAPHTQPGFAEHWSDHLVHQFVHAPGRDARSDHDTRVQVAAEMDLRALSGDADAEPYAEAFAGNLLQFAAANATNRTDPGRCLLAREHVRAEWIAYLRAQSGRC
jgi:hypothetical protein